MNFNDVVALAHAGFTAAQIAAMAQNQNQPYNQNQNQPYNQNQNQNQPYNQNQNQPYNQNQNQPYNQNQNQPYNQNQNQNQNQPDPIAALMAQMGVLTSAVQGMNIGNSTLPQPENTDQILASIINPPNVGNK